MLRALIRTAIRGLLVLVLTGCALVAYQLYRSGRLPFVQKALQDAALLGSVKAAFAVHRDLSRRPIEIAVDERRVTLSGAVASEGERAAATELAASVEGVERVENRLELDPDIELEDDPGRSLGDKLDEVALLAKVRTALHLDRKTRDAALDVDVHGGTVVLRGRVASTELAQAIRSRVLAVGGVREVDDRLILESGGALEELARKVEAAFSESENLSRYTLRATAGQDALILQGAVETNAERELARLLAEKWAPSSKIRNEILLR